MQVKRTVHIESRSLCQYAGFDLVSIMPKLKRCGFFETFVDTIELSGKILKFIRQPTKLNDIALHSINIILRGGSVPIISLERLGNNEYQCSLIRKNEIHWNNAKFVWPFYFLATIFEFYRVASDYKT